MENSTQQLENSQQMTRVEKIVEWLSTQKDLVGPLSSSPGFFVTKGKIIRLKNGTEVEVFDWLNNEGIIDGKRIFGYKVKLLPAKDQYEERLIFFKEVIDAPF